MIVISTIIGIVLLLILCSVWLTNKMDKNKEQKINNGEEVKENHNGYFSSWWKFAIGGVIALFIINIFINSFESKPPLENDWNYDGKVNEKDLDTYIKWKNKQNEE